MSECRDGTEEARRECKAAQGQKHSAPLRASWAGDGSWLGALGHQVPAGPASLAMHWGWAPEILLLPHRFPEGQAGPEKAKTMAFTRQGWTGLGRAAPGVHPLSWVLGWLTS